MGILLRRGFIAVKIAVCIKRVPEMDVKFRIAPSGDGVDETGLKFDMSDFDGYAAEAAIQIKEKVNAGEVVVVCLGPDVVQETLRKALSMGADRAVQLKADAVPVDPWAIAEALAAELKTGSFDLVLFGRMSLDVANQSVAPMVAELLGLPCVTAVSQLDTSGGSIKARRELEGAAELVECPLPAVVSSSTRTRPGTAARHAAYDSALRTSPRWRSSRKFPGWETRYGMPRASQRSSSAMKLCRDRRRSAGTGEARLMRYES